MAAYEMMACPFCGQIPSCIVRSDGLLRDVYVKCLGCGAQGPDTGRDEYEAIANWNARVICPPGVQVREGRIRPSSEDAPHGERMWDEVMTKQHQLAIGFDKEAYLQL